MQHTYQYLIVWPDILKFEVPSVQEWKDGLMSEVIGVVLLVEFRKREIIDLQENVATVRKG
jgi:hypothetical protein